MSADRRQQTDIRSEVLFLFSMSTVLAEELINTVRKGLRILPIHVDDQRRTLLVAVFNHERDITPCFMASSACESRSVSPSRRMSLIRS